MASPNNTRLYLQRLEEERQRQREEERRQQALERRQEEERERQREEERRQEALRQAQAFEAALDAARQQRDGLLARIRAQRQAERREAARVAQHRAALLDVLRAADRQARLAAEAEQARREAARQQDLAARQAAQRQAGQVAERQAAARQARLEAQRQAEQAARQAEARRSEARQVRLQAQREAGQAAEQVAAHRAAARQARLEAQRQADRAAEQTDARRLEARQARLEDQRAAERTAEQVEARRAEARQAQLEEQRRADQAARQAETRRAEARQVQWAEQRAAERAAGQADARRAETRQARLAEQRAAEHAAGQARVRRPAAHEGNPRDGRGTPSADREMPERNPLQARIPSGELSGALPWLRVNGNKIATLDGDPVILRGISLLGLDSAEPDPEQGFAAGAGITEATIDAILNWGVTVIRLAINRDRVLNGFQSWTAWDYLADLDWIIQRAANGGAYTMLSLRRLDNFTVFGTRPGPDGQHTPNFIAPLPDFETIGMWRILGERYAAEPAVLFDLYTSPHQALEDDLSGFDADWDLWAVWIRLMVADLRRMHPGALCFVSGLNWGTDLSGFPVIGTGGQPMADLVYAAHLYPGQENPWPAMRALARKYPVFVTEWGGGQADLSWGSQCAPVLRAASIGWTAAHWNADPPLTRVAGRNVVPTPFGAVIHRALALAGEPLEATLPTVPAVLDP